MEHQFTNSAIAPQIQLDAEKNGEWDRDPHLNMSGIKQSDCGFPSRMEDLFASMTAHWMVSRLTRFLGGGFNDLVYCPNTVVEADCGFDQSFGVYSKTHRLRLAHKYLGRWCDEEWSYPAGQMSSHFVLLQSAFRGTKGRCKPYLVLHICNCLHDYRRMGSTIGGVKIPSIDSRIRTVVVDLEPLVSGLSQNALKSIASQTVIVQRQRKTISSYFVKGTKEIDLPVIGLEDLLGIAKAWLQQ